MFWVAHRSLSGALTVFAASGLHTHVVTGRRQVWVWTQFPFRLDYSWSPHAYVNQRLQIQLELLMMSGVPLETCWAFNERWNNKFYYKVVSCWLFLLSHTAMHGSMNIKLFPCFSRIVCYQYAYNGIMITSYLGWIQYMLYCLKNSLFSILERCIIKVNCGGKHQISWKLKTSYQE
jgi:hypothetical protein